jgi:transketolase
LNNVIYDDPRKCLGASLVELADDNKVVVFLSCDSSLGTGAGPFHQKYSERHFEFGIAEQNAMSHAAGLAISGKVPFIAAYVPFVIYRCFEQIRNDVCKTKLNANIMGNNSGFSVSALGPTHTILEDVAVLRSLPNMSMLATADGIECMQALYLAFQTDDTVYICISRLPSKRIYAPDHRYLYAKADILRTGSDIPVIASGNIVSLGLDAAELLSKQNIGLELINLSTIKHIDQKTVLESVTKTRKVITIEEHSTINGIGSAVVDQIVREGPVKMDIISVADEYAPFGSYAELMSHYGLTVENIASRTKTFLNLY